ncbi:MAG: hypothetical protein PHX30_01555 [Candidatus Pacebacteria bacterium]|nr:hypothetical protein [Candidatus Paceibacterota bacterium]
MDEKDQIILEDSIHAILSNIPGLNIAWGLSTALYGSALKLRQKKVLEWVEMVRDNPNIFVTDLLQNEFFQDGFAYSLEKYVVERNEEKRKYFRNIFLGFSSSNDMQNFPLEKFVHTLSQLGKVDVTVLGDVNIMQQDSEYQIYGNENHKLIYIYNLINLGILSTSPTTRYGPIHAPFVRVSAFGGEFIKYIKDEK